MLTTTLTRVATITAPPESRHVADRWSDAAQRAGADPEQFADGRLLHTDLNEPGSLLVGDVDLPAHAVAAQARQTTSLGVRP
jgi:hypothetical protein